MATRIPEGINRRWSFASERGAIDETARTAVLSWSSDLPVDMGYGTEILSHKPGAVDLTRLNAGAPLLWNHDRDEMIGIVRKAWIDKGKGYAEVQFSRSEDGVEKFQDVVDGILVNTSVGYCVQQYVEDVDTETYTATRWQPYEISLVSIPADTSVGVGRQAPESTTPAQPATTQEETAMDDVQTVADQHAADTTQTRAAPRVESSARMSEENSATNERNRITAIRNYCKEHRIDEKLTEKWIANGASTETVAHEVLAILGERSKNTANMAAYLDMPESDRKRYSVIKAIRAVGAKNWKEAGLELECHREIAKRTGREVSGDNNFFVPMEYTGGRRDLTVGTGNAGGFLVETSNVGFIDLLRNQSVLMAMGSTRLSGLTGNVAVPKQTAAGSTTWLANEAATITESQLTLGQLTLTPKTVGGYMEYSRLLLLQGSPNAEALVMQDLAKIVALDVDLKGLNGSGAAGQPTGIINTAGIGSVTGTSIAYAGIVEFQTDTASANALSDASGYVTTPAVAGLLKQRVKFTSTASPIWEGKLLSGSVDGYKAMSSNQVPSANLLFGDFSQVILAEWGALEIEVNPFANFQAGISGVRAMYTIDIGVRIPAAFSLATTVT